MELAQVRLPKEVIKQMDSLVKRGLYSNKSDFMRASIRRALIEAQIGSIKNTGDSVKEIKEIRKLLSKKDINLDEINFL